MLYTVEINKKKEENVSTGDKVIDKVLKDVANDLGYSDYSEKLRSSHKHCIG